MDLDWIREGLKKPGKTQVGLAKALNLDGSQVSRLLSGKRELKAREIAIIERYLDEVEPAPAPLRPSQNVRQLTEEPRRSGIPFPIELPAFAEMPKDLEVWGTSAGGKQGGDFTLNGTTVDFVRRPPGLLNVPGAFGLYIQGDSMSPWKESGELIYLHPGRPVNPGDYVVVELKAEHDGEPGDCLVKRLRRRTATQLILEQHRPHDDKIVIDARRVRRIFKVLSQEELLGI